MADRKALVMMNGTLAEIQSTDRLEVPSLASDGSIASKRTPVDADHPIAADDCYLGVDTTASRLLTLPTAVGRTGQQYAIKDETGQAGTNPITVRCTGSETIDGQSSVAIDVGYGFLGVISNGTNWSIILRGP
jgi:hypothetical protein